MKVLLLDDQANRGWSDVLAHILKESEITCCLDIQSAISLIHKQFDLIILDMRLEESDKGDHISSNFSSYNFLTEHIRKDFSSRNFSTPVLLFTASSKAWYIDAFIQGGADDYYIKEHFNYFTAEQSMENFKRTFSSTGSIERIVQEGKKRTRIWNKSHNIIDNVKHNLSNANIAQRITDKLKVGYGLLFHPQNKLYAEKLLLDKEVHAFVQYFSILEEITKDFLDLDALGYREEVIKGEWKFKNGRRFRTQSKDERGYISLGNQVKECIRNYLIEDKETDWYDLFIQLNLYRNKVSITHSRIDHIIEKPLTDARISSEAYAKCIDMLELLDFITSAEVQD